MKLPNVSKDKAFEGEDYSPERDYSRFKRQQDIIFDYMQDGEWRTVQDICDKFDFQPVTVTARLRGFRAEKNGGHTVEKRYIENGLWEYRVLVNDGTDDEAEQFSLAL